MRIVAGGARGCRLEAGRSAAIRPTAERVREALFSTLLEAVVGATVLDLYAGAGTLGLEALSRGADRVLLVERDRAACRLLRRNVAAVVHRLAISPGLAEIWEADVSDALRRLGLRGRRFSLILADPPYAEGSEAADAAGAQVLVRVAESGLLLPGGWLVLEHAREWSPGDAPGGLQHWTTRAYGRTALTYWFAPRPRAGGEESTES